MMPRHGRILIALAAGSLLLANACTAPMPVRPLAGFGSQAVVGGKSSGTITGGASAVVTPPIVYDHTHAIFNYTQAGLIRWYEDASNGAYTAGDGNSISFSFSGVGLHLYGSLQARGCPNIDVVVDGTPYTMSCYNGGTTTPAYDQPLLDIPVLAVGTHTCTITNPTRGKYIYFTFAVVDQPPSVDVTANVTDGQPAASLGPITWGP